MKIENNQTYYNRYHQQTSSTKGSNTSFGDEIQLAKTNKIKDTEKKRDTYSKSSEYFYSLEFEQDETEKTSKKLKMESEEVGKESEETKQDNTTESETNSNIVVNPDGTRVLVITTSVGGMETTASIELAKEAGIQQKENPLQDETVNKVGVNASKQINEIEEMIDMIETMEQAES